MRARHVVLSLLLLAFVPSPHAVAQGNGKESAPDPKGLIPPPKMWAAQVTPTEFNLVWGRVPAATRFEILVRDLRGNLVTLGSVAANVSRFIVPVTRLGALGLADAPLQFLVRAYNGAVAGPLGQFNTVRIAKQGTAKALVAPANVAARETSPGVITVTWTDVPDATAYAIGRATGAYGFQRFCDVCPTGGVLVDTVPTAGTKYAYSVTAIMPGGRSRAARTEPVEITRLATDAGGGVVATSGGVPYSDPKGLADGVTITARSVASGVVQVAVNFAVQQGGISAELVRRVCGGPLEVIRTVGNLLPFNLDDRVGGLEFPECNGVRKQSFEYFVRIRDPKGAVAQSKAAIAEVEVAAGGSGSGSGAGTGSGSGAGSTGTGTASAAPDPKGHAAGITVTARASGGLVGNVLRVAVEIGNSLARQWGLDEVPGRVAHLMQQVCDRPWEIVREIALDVPLVQLDHAVNLGDLQCGTGKRDVRYIVRVSDPKGLAGDSKESTVEIPVSSAPEATEPPATPGNRSVARTSSGRRTLTWAVVPAATSYRIERIAGAKGAWTVVQELPGTATSWTDVSPPSGEVRYRITAVNRAGNSATGNFP